MIAMSLSFEIRLFINVEIVIIGGDARRHIDGRAAEGNVRRSDRKPVIRADRLGRIDLDASVFILEIIVLLESHLRNRNVSDLQGRIEFKTRFGKDKRSLDDLARGDRTVVSGSRRVGDPENAGREVVERHLPVNRIGHAVNHATGIDQVHLGSRILIALQFGLPVHTRLDRIEVGVIVGFAALELHEIGGSLHDDEVGIALQSPVARTDAEFSARRRRGVEMDDVVIGVEREYGTALRNHRIVGRFGFARSEILTGSDDRIVGIEFQEKRVAAVNALAFGIQLHPPAVFCALKYSDGFLDRLFNAFRRRFREFILIVLQAGIEKQGQSQ